MAADGLPPTRAEGNPKKRTALYWSPDPQKKNDCPWSQSLLPKNRATDMRILHYLRVYREFVNTSFSEAMTYRLHFMLLILMDLAFYAATLGSVSFIYDQVETIGLWKREEFLFFVSFVLAIDHLHMTFVSPNFWQFSFDLRTGKLDFVLLRPIGAIFSIFFRTVRPASLVNIVVPWGCMIHYGMEAGLPSWGWVALPALVLAGLCLYVSLEILLSMSMFWFVESMGINFVRIQFQRIARWPDFVYGYYGRKLFTFVFPVLLVGSAPVRFLFDPTDYWPLVGLAAAVGATWLLTGVFFRLGLRAYESASS